MAEFTHVGKWIEFLLLFVISVTIHEFAHAFAADRLGDKTPRSQGRLTLNPIDHIDPIGLLAMAAAQWFGVGLGWGRPVQTNPHNFKHPRRDSMIVAFAGPLSNLLQAVIIAMPLRYGWVQPGSNIQLVLVDAVFLNALLFFFNLLPIGPLDGAKVISGLLHEKDALKFEAFMRQFGLVLFILLIITPATRYIIVPPATSLVTHLAPDYYYVEQ